jgi:hypothetical protein
MLEIIGAVVITCIIGYAIFALYGTLFVSSMDTGFTWGHWVATVFVTAISAVFCWSWWALVGTNLHVSFG